MVPTVPMRFANNPTYCDQDRVIRRSWQLDEVAIPKAGSVALFQNKLRYEGCEVRGIKYALCRDTIDRAPEGSTISIDVSVCSDTSEHLLTSYGPQETGWQPKKYR
jgi:hypothetical protein